MKGERQAHEVAAGERSHRILGVEITGGGYLNGVALELSPRLNCTIGPRGSGKTTLNELLAHALLPGDDPARQALVAANLRGGTVRVRVETRGGARYVVEREATGEARVLEEDGRPARVTLAHVFDVEAYSQSEIEAIAQDRPAQLRLIDRFVGPELRALHDELDAALRELRVSAADCQALTGELAQLQSGVAELGAVQDQLRVARTRGGATSAPFQEAVALKSLREREVRAFEALERHLAAQRAALDEVVRLAAAPDEGVPPPVTRGPNGPVFDGALSALDRCRADARAGAAAIRAALDQGAERLAGHRARLREAHEEQELRYREVADRHAAERGRAQERLALERRLTELEGRQRQLEERRARLVDTLVRRRALTARVQQARERRAALRQAVAADLTARLAPEIRVQVDVLHDNTAYREVLARAFHRCGRPYNALVSRVVATLGPLELARAVFAGAVEPLAARLGDREDAVRLLDQLRDTPAVHELETVELGDVPTITLRLDDGGHRASHELSTGQRCTTILPILLLQSERPLLIDQPEDHLDNRYLAEVVCRRVRDVKQHRQLLFVTHNPNLPVLGGAECVVVLDSRGATGEVVAVGPVDDPEIKVQVATLLEGGKDAFETRKRHYGY